MDSLPISIPLRFNYNALVHIDEYKNCIFQFH